MIELKNKRSERSASNFGFSRTRLNGFSRWGNPQDFSTAKAVLTGSAEAEATCATFY
jgi:hypothetical protein